MPRSRGWWSNSGSPRRLTMYGDLHVYHTDEQMEKMKEVGLESMVKFLKNAYVQQGKIQLWESNGFQLYFKKSHVNQVVIM